MANKNNVVFQLLETYSGRCFFMHYQLSHGTRVFFSYRISHLIYYELAYIEIFVNIIRQMVWACPRYEQKQAIKEDIVGVGDELTGKIVGKGD